MLITELTVFLNSFIINDSFGASMLISLENRRYTACVTYAQVINILPNIKQALLRDVTSSYSAFIAILYKMQKCQPHCRQSFTRVWRKWEREWENERDRRGDDKALKSTLCRFALQICERMKCARTLDVYIRREMVVLRQT